MKFGKIVLQVQLDSISSTSVMIYNVVTYLRVHCELCMMMMMMIKFVLRHLEEL